MSNGLHVKYFLQKLMLIWVHNLICVLMSCLRHCSAVSCYNRTHAVYQTCPMYQYQPRYRWSTHTIHRPNPYHVWLGHLIWQRVLKIKNESCKGVSGGLQLLLLCVYGQSHQKCPQIYWYRWSNCEVNVAHNLINVSPCSWRCTISLSLWDHEVFVVMLMPLGEAVGCDAFVWDTLMQMNSAIHEYIYINAASSIILLGMILSAMKGLFLNSNGPYWIQQTKPLGSWPPLVLTHVWYVVLYHLCPGRSWKGTLVVCSNPTVLILLLCYMIMKWM